MLQMGATITIIDSNGETFNDVYNYTGYSNIKNPIASTITSVLNTRKVCKNQFIIGKNIIGDGSRMYESLDYYASRDISDSNGNFATEFKWNISVGQYTSINDITIVFDTLNNRYPPIINIDGIDYVNDDAVFTTTLPPIDIYHPVRTLTIRSWSDSDCPLVITGIYNGIVLNIQGKNMISLTIDSADRQSNNSPNFGIISNGGELKFLDTYSDFEDYKKIGLLDNPLPIETYLIDTLTGKRVALGTFVSKKITIPYTGANIITISLDDGLTSLQEIQVDTISTNVINEYDSSALLSHTMQKLYEYIISLLPTDFGFEAVGNMAIEVQNRLARTVCINPYFLGSSAWAQLTKICVATGLYMYKNTSGKIVFSEE